jgi:hypothetical protein
MKIFKSIFCIKNLAGFLFCMSIPLLGQMKSAVPAGGSLGKENGSDVLALVDGKKLQ